MFLDELISNCIKLCQFFLYLDNDPKTCSTQHIFCCSVTKICVHSYITSKRIKLECSTTSQIEDNFKDFQWSYTFLCLNTPRAYYVQKRPYPLISQLSHSGLYCKLPHHLLSAPAHLKVFFLLKSKRQ